MYTVGVRCIEIISYDGSVERTPGLAGHTGRCGGLLDMCVSV